MKIEPHEARDVTFGQYAVIAAALVACVIAAFIVSYGLERALLQGFARADAGRALVPAVLPPEPRLEPDNSGELASLRAHEDDLLSRYRWVDRRRGLARIPLSRAIDLALARGFATKPLGRRP